MKKLFSHLKSSIVNFVAKINRLLNRIFSWAKSIIENIENQKISYAIIYILTEVFILGKYKYTALAAIFSFLEKSFPSKLFHYSQINKILNEQLDCIKMVILLILIILSIFVYKKNKQKTSNINAGFFISIVKGLQAKIGSFSSILFTIIILSHIGWIGNFLSDGDSFDILKSTILFMFLLLFVLLNLLFFFEGESKTTNTHKVLITSLPQLRGIDTLYSNIQDNYLPNLDNYDLKIADKGNPGDYIWGNVEPIRKILLKKSEVEKIVFLCSTEVISNSIEIANLSRLIEQFKAKTGKTFTFEFNPYEFDNKKGFDANDIKEVKYHAEKLLSYLLEEVNYKNTDIFFNLTTGTTVITSIFTLKAITEGREAYHIHQTNGKMMQVNLNVLTIQELWDELMEKL